jgi:hypothetical protein
MERIMVNLYPSAKSNQIKPTEQGWEIFHASRVNYDQEC